MFERLVESTVFYSRWLLAPMFVGLALGLVLLLVSFISEFVHFFSTDGIFHSKATALFILDDLERPEWMGKVDFAGLKLKVISALVAISSIELLKVFLNSSSYEEGEILWRVIIHSVFVASGFVFALTEKFMPHK